MATTTQAQQYNGTGVLSKFVKYCCKTLEVPGTTAWDNTSRNGTNSIHLNHWQALLMVPAYASTPT
jgi:hypothetical protein